MEHDRSTAVAAVAALAEPTRRRVYDHVVRQPAAVSRDDTVAALDLPRATAAFHLDRLVADGLLDVHYERRTGRTGPGAGRPAKLYRRSDRAVAVSLPERSYDLAGDLLAAALTEAESSGRPPREALGRRAYERGQELGAAVARNGGQGRDGALRVLEENGFEPRVEDDGITLVNCPFHRLARAHSELVCGMNLRLIDGVLDQVSDSGLVASLRPTPDTCCVRLDRAPAVLRRQPAEGH
ncbi:MAG: putative transcriptional regulator [Blastococcus sp.]|jgi:predicted ArsR family transcriptional regulator|nr:putative transcriptional regulator [Blastococcus sp.]